MIQLKNPKEFATTEIVVFTDLMCSLVLDVFDENENDPDCKDFLPLIEDFANYCQNITNPIREYLKEHDDLQTCFELSDLSIQLWRDINAESEEEKLNLVDYILLWMDRKTKSKAYKGWQVLDYIQELRLKFNMVKLLYSQVFNYEEKIDEMKTRFYTVLNKYDENNDWLYKYRTYEVKHKPKVQGES